MSTPDPLNVPIADDAHITRLAGDTPWHVGQWVWVKGDGEAFYNRNDRVVDGYWLACIMHIGSNVIAVEAPRLDGTGLTDRIHLNDAWRELKPIADVKPVLAERIDALQNRARGTMTTIADLTARLGVSPSAERTPGDQGTGLAVLSGQTNLKAYEGELMEAAKSTLPALFEDLKKTHGLLADWMGAEALSMQALCNGYTGTIGVIKDRMFNITLYAGLTERCVQIREGAPAAEDAVLHVMQRRLYMDEECLAGYSAGGISAETLPTFDAWLCEPEQFHRILPFERCLVAFRVRRHPKDREALTFRDLIDNVNLTADDKKTYLYMRNGEQLFWLETDLDFGELLFPDHGLMNLSEPIHVVMHAGHVDKVMTSREFADREAAWNRIEALREAWFAETPFAVWAAAWQRDNPGKPALREDFNRYEYKRACPHRHGDTPEIGRGFFSSNDFCPDQWKAFNDDHLYRDEIAAWLDDQVKQYNRVALVLQGLLDRSTVFHPHAPVKTWLAEDFQRAIRLVHDGDSLLTAGDAPDWEAYRAACNASITAESWLFGQDEVWAVGCADQKRKASSHERWPFSGFQYRPYGDPGPGAVAQPVRWDPKNQVATFAWTRQRLREKLSYSGRVIPSDPIKVTLKVKAADLFNISAYQPGDLQRFFKDARSRERYLPWAAALVSAERFHAQYGKADSADHVWEATS